MIDGEAVLILSEMSKINVLNPVGSRVFELADGTRSLKEIAQLITDEFDVSFEQAEADVLTFLQQMVADDVMVFANTREDA